jgi:simple sugar transport system permease protein
MIQGLWSAAAPILLASLGALLTDLGGILGIFIEGFMVFGSFFAWIIAGWTGSVFTGSAISALAAGLAGCLLSRFVHKTKANPFIAGLALNLAAAGVTESCSTIWFGTKGVLRNPGLHIPGPLVIPFAERLPLVGTLVSGQLPFVYVSWICTVVLALVIDKTHLGLRLKASGLAPEAASDQGIRIERCREYSWGAAAFLATLAGAALTFRVGSYSPGGIAGRGWIALAAVYLGFRTIWGTAAAAVLFALAERIGFMAQAFTAIPATVMLGVPSALALVLFSFSQSIGSSGKRKKPR